MACEADVTDVDDAEYVCALTRVPGIAARIVIIGTTGRSAADVPRPR